MCVASFARLAPHATLAGDPALAKRFASASPDRTRGAESGHRVSARLAIRRRFSLGYPGSTSIAL
jgi:hypothetical protein